MAEIVEYNAQPPEDFESWYDLQSDEVKQEIDMAVLERMKDWETNWKNKI